MEKILSWMPVIFPGVMGAVVLLFLNGASRDNLWASGVLIMLSAVFGGWAARVNIELTEMAGDECQEITGWFGECAYATARAGKHSSSSLPTDSNPPLHQPERGAFSAGS